MYIPSLLYGGKSAQQLSYGFNILDKLESCPHENQFFIWGYGFFKKGFKSNRFQVVVWSQDLRFSYFSFLKGFPAKKMASLALSVLKPSHAIDLLPAGCEVKVKKVITFWSFIFPETYIYYIACI